MKIKYKHKSDKTIEARQRNWQHYKDYIFKFVKKWRLHLDPVSFYKNLRSPYSLITTSILASFSGTFDSKNRLTSHKIYYYKKLIYKSSVTNVVQNIVIGAIHWYPYMYYYSNNIQKTNGFSRIVLV